MKPKFPDHTHLRWLLKSSASELDRIEAAYLRAHQRAFGGPRGRAKPGHWLLVWRWWQSNGVK